MPLMLNDVKLGGNLTRDPELRAVGESNTVANFGLAINRRYKSGDEMKEETTFLDIECWGRQAELCGQYLTKGRNVLIEGALKLQQWEDKEGNKRSKITVNARRVHFIGNPANEGGQNTTTTRRSSYNESSSPVAPSQPIDDEPPF